MAQFSPAAREWFASSYPSPTEAQIAGWPHISAGEHTLICAPTGSGKTLTAFFSAIDRLVTQPPVEDRTRRTRVLYLSPLRALAFDVEKNLRSPLVGIGHAADRLGTPFTPPVVAMRTGDTPANERQRLVRNPPDLLITTPESLYLMLTSRAAETLRGVETVIIDEIHAVATTKRGAHLALTLERLVEVCDRDPQRIGLSATQRPLSETARFLGGYDADGPRSVEIVDAGVSKQLEVEVVVPVEDMTAPAADGTPSIWPSIYPEILDRILAHRSTIIFCNARRAAERLAAKLNEEYVERMTLEAGDDGDDDAADDAAADDDAGKGGGALSRPDVDLVRAHHGSLAREQRVEIEDQLKRGQLRAIVATSSLELGIDMGAVDHVIQVESPGAVSRGLQRIGRAGHQVGEPSVGTVFPKHRGDLIESAVVVRRMLDGEIEQSQYLRNPLDVLAQQIVAYCATDEDADLPVEQIATMVRRSANFHDLSDDLFTNTLDLLSGRYPSDEFSELRPRLVWDRVNATVRARRGSKRLAVTSGGTIPDRGLFGVFLPDGTRVGELDEEMVYETRPGETFILGASTWRIEDITFAKVIVTPAPGVPGRMPFWHGDAPGRPVELGRAVGAFLREVRDASDRPADLEELGERYQLTPYSLGNLDQYLSEQVEATGLLPDDRTIVVERFRDEIGDWRVCILSPYGTPIHAPWAMAIEHRIGEVFDLPVETLWSDDGIVIRLPDAVEHIDTDLFLIDPEEIEDIVVSALPNTALFAARFRECAGRSLLLPRRRPDQRTPLWQQRQRAADLLAVAAKFPSFPILLETSRECLQDVFDVPALRSLLTDLRNRKVRLVAVDTAGASPMASSLLFRWIDAYMYAGDAPLAERRAAALSLDRDLLRDLLGTEALRDLFDAEVMEAVQAELQCVTENRRARGVDELHDVLRKVGDLTLAEAAMRATAAPDEVARWMDDLVRARRAFEFSIGPADSGVGSGEVRFAAAEDAARYRDGLGVAIPIGLPAEFTEPVGSPLEQLVGRYARTHAPFVATDVAMRWSTPAERVHGALIVLADADRIVEGEFWPDGTGREWCDNEVLRQIRRRTLASLRKEVEPVDGAALARFLIGWNGLSNPRRGPDATAEAVANLAGAALPVSALERDILPARVANYRTGMLDELTTSGELVWVGSEAIGSGDGRIRLFFRDQIGKLISTWDPPSPPDDPLVREVRTYLAAHGASFFAQLRAASPTATDAELIVALWDLVWAGEATNDSVAPLRALVSSGGVSPTRNGKRRSHKRGYRSATRVNRGGPPTAVGRWSLVDDLAAREASTTESTHVVTMQLLDRYGVLTRETVLAEGVRGGFALVYDVLKVLEERGEVRRGYFVAGLGAAQFALHGAVERLRDEREVTVRESVVMSAVDPAQPYGATLGWPATPGRPSRIPSALVVLTGGVPGVWLDRRSHHLVTFESIASANDDGLDAAGLSAETADRDSWAEALAALVADGRESAVEVRKVNSGPIPAEIAEALAAAGFVEGYRGWTIRQ